MIFERTYDTTFIYECITNPRVWRMSADDSTPPPELFFVPVQDNIIWVKAGDYGLFMLIRQDDGTHEVHLALNGFALGVAIKIAREAIQWAFVHIKDCRTLVARIPEYNHQAMGLAKRAGFKFYGIDQNLFRKEGIGHDMHIYTLNKEDICHRQQAQQQQ